MGINDPNIYKNSQLNLLCCSLTTPMNGNLNNIPIITNSYSKKNNNKKTFSPEEDEALLNLVKKQGVGNWQKISTGMKLWDFYSKISEYELNIFSIRFIALKYEKKNNTI